MFGAYTHCKWPKDKDSGVVADRSGHSFLFSLTNAVNKPVRFSLRKKEHAIAVSSIGFRFGFDGANFALNHGGRAADEAQGNNAWQLSQHSAYQPDDGVACGAVFFAGSKLFAAAEVEVYEL